MFLSELTTPCLLLDRGRVRKNCADMHSLANRAGVTLRPHIKTAKSVPVAALAAGAGGPLTVSTMAEAEAFAAAGHHDLTLAVCAKLDTLDRTKRLRTATGARVQLLVDDPDALTVLIAEARRLDESFDFLVEIDSGEHRSGRLPDDPRVIELAVMLKEAGMGFAGVLTHGGHSYGCKSERELVDVADQERRSVVEAAQRLRASGIVVPCVSAGSTPTILRARSFEGLTEIRPGCYTLFDLVQLGLGVCRRDQLALSVLATVISRNLEHGRVIIDAGALALSKDLGAAASLPHTGYGQVCGPDLNQMADLHLAVLDQEHGYVEGDPAALSQLRIGDRVRVLPNHACITAACHDGYQVLENGGIVDCWERVNGW